MNSRTQLMTWGFLALFLSMNSTIYGDDANTASTKTKPSSFRLVWEKNFLTISGDSIPGGEITVMYLEAYCRPGSTDRDWRETTIGHMTELVDASEDGKTIRLKCTLNDGVIVTHKITAVTDGVQFDLKATNPTKTASLADWAQPCVRVDRFTGRDQKTYLEKLFVFLDDELTRMPTPNWATKARYTPGQVWCPQGVNRNDVNPRPLSDDIPSNGLIGCFSSDESMILASAWHPYQELFQGVANCVHADFRIGGLKPGESKTIRGKLYIVPADVEALVKLYEQEFPEHRAEN
ncbi:MAG: hypothetical protein O2955_07800 [Planctomycetota bacterium]|nr:hypothetical protein [Planctomycetota bacterium]MDA1212404.1 hypothetical protein [Planctomycetota bacterium]